MKNLVVLKLNMKNGEINEEKHENTELQRAIAFYDFMDFQNCYG